LKALRRSLWKKPSGLWPSGFFLRLLPSVEIDYLGFEVVVKPD